MAVTIITGGTDCGKTSWCQEVFLKKHLDCAGLLLLKRMTGARRIGYDAHNIGSGESVPFARFDSCLSADWVEAERVGLFSISLEGKQKANEWLRQSLVHRSILIDEMGPLEIRGGGIADAARQVLQHREEKDLYIVVRQVRLASICSCFGITDYCILSI